MTPHSSSTKDTRDTATDAPAKAATEDNGVSPADVTSGPDGQQASSGDQQATSTPPQSPLPAPPQNDPQALGAHWRQTVLRHCEAVESDIAAATVEDLTNAQKAILAAAKIDITMAPAPPAPPQNGPQARAALWRQTVLRHCEAVESDIAAATVEDLTNAQKAILAAAKADITSARAIATSTRVSLGRWWSGGTVESAWVQVREPEERVIDVVAPSELHTRAVRAAIDARRHGIGTTNPAIKRMCMIQDHLTKDGTPVPTDTDTVAAYRAAIRTVVHLSNARSDRANQDARATRNRMIITWVLAALTAVALVVLQWRIDTPLLPSPRGWDDVSSWVVMLTVMAFGVVGALLTVIPVLSGTPTDRSPFNLPLQQAIVKLGAGTLSAVAGLLVLSAADATGLNLDFDAVDPPAFLLMAMVFGASQQALTRYFDRRADEVLAPPKPPETPDAG